VISHTVTHGTAAGRRQKSRSSVNPPLKHSGVAGLGESPKRVEFDACKA
jgi:hypothetical protein